MVNHPFCPSCLSRLEPCDRPFRIGEYGAEGRTGWVKTRDGELYVHGPPENALLDTATAGGLDVCAPFKMNDASLEIARLIKFSGRRSLVPLAAAAMAYALHTQAGVGRDALLVPVPMHRSALRRRGFNQAELLAAAVSRTLEISVVTQSLRKALRTRRQSQTSRDRRADNVRGAFGWVGPRLSGRHAVVVDDLVTTGATAAVCAGALAAAGARKVTVACLARGL